MGVKTKKAMTETDAMALLLAAEQMKAEAEALMMEHGISDLLEKADVAKALVTTWALENDVEKIVVDNKTGRYYGMRKDTYNKRVIGDDDELAEVKTPEGVIPLKTILKKKFKKGWQEIWKQATTRRVDTSKLEKLVADGTLTVNDISPAYYHDTKSPYLRSYGKSE